MRATPGVAGYDSVSLGEHRLGNRARKIREAREEHGRKLLEGVKVRNFYDSAKMEFVAGSTKVVHYGHVSSSIELIIVALNDGFVLLY